MTGAPLRQTEPSRAAVPRDPAAPWRRLRGRLAAASDRLRAWLRPPGALVVLMGPDGAGKTTLAGLVRERLGAAGVRTSTVYLGSQQPLLPTRRLSQAVRGRRPGARRHAVHDVDRRNRLRGLVHILADQTLRYVLHVRPRLVRGELVILDRYFYDYRVFPHPMVGRPWVSALAQRLTPRPALVFSLAGNPSVIAARKGELTVAETARQLDCYDELRRSLPGARALSADGDLTALVDEVTAGVVNLYAEGA